MEPVIRPNQNIEPRPIKAWGLWAIILGVVVLILGAAFLAASNAIQMGWPPLYSLAECLLLEALVFYRLL